MEYESSIKEIIANSLDQVRTIIDADTVVGKPIPTSGGTTIIPISKVSMGFASGGLDLPASTEDAAKSFGGGGGTGVTVSPIGFLTVYSDGRVELLPLTQDKATPIEQIADLMDQAPAVITRIKNAIAGREETATEEEIRKIEEEYDDQLDTDPYAGLSEKEIKKLKKQEARAQKKAAKPLDF